jgi:hypothetical protein
MPFFMPIYQAQLSLIHSTAKSFKVSQVATTNFELVRWETHCPNLAATRKRQCGFPSLTFKIEPIDKKNQIIPIKSLT